MPNLAIASAIKLHCGYNSGYDRGCITNHNCSHKALAGSHNCEVELLYIGSRFPLDSQLVKAAGLRFKSIFTGKFRRYFSFRNFIDPIFIIIGFFQSIWIIISFWPDVVFAKGGFVCLPVAIAAFIFRRPIILHESDRIMGLSNRIVAKLATKVCVAFPDVIKNSEKVILTGNPVRLSIQHGDAKKGYEITGFNPHRPVVLIWGGSQGSQEINQILENSFNILKNTFQFVHVTGYGKRSSITNPSYYIQFEYLGDELKHIYAITDIVVGRSGANSLYELALMQKPNILIPLKTSAHNHQQLNAEYFEQMGASIILRDNSLYDVLTALWHSPEQRGLMKNALERVAKPEAAEQIAELILVTTRRNNF